VRKLMLVVLLGCLSLAAPAWADDVPSADPPPAARPAPAADSGRPDAEQVDIDRKTQMAGRLGFEGPLGAAARLTVLHGLGADVEDEDGRVKAVCAAPLSACAKGFLFEAAAGSGGGRLSLGLGARAHIDEEDFRGTAGFALKLSLARTWGHPVGTEPDLTYLGPELDLAFKRVGLTLGVLWRTSGHGGPLTLFSWGVGVVL
jgi:hypothetical protein